MGAWFRIVVQGQFEVRLCLWLPALSSRNLKKLERMGLGFGRGFGLQGLRGLEV